MEKKCSRITVVDCLRGFALFGLFIVHMVEYFELFWYAPEWGWVHDTIFFLFGGKAYAIFALLFGLSFFIIIDNQAQRGVDFRGRFAWRLALLLAMGYLHGLLYAGDILQVLALCGFLLLPAWSLSNRTLLLIAAVCLLQIPAWIHGILMAQGVMAAGDPLHWSMMGDTFEVFAHGTFGEVVQRNIWYGQAGKWLFMIESGRIWNVLGLFLVGFVLGRVRFFENYREILHLCLAALGAGILLLGVVHVAGLVTGMTALPKPALALMNNIFTQYQNNLLTAIGVLVFLLAYEAAVLRRFIDWLAPAGRMSLTIYVTQSLYGVPLFYGFGLGLYTGFGQLNALLLGLALWGVQLVSARYWIRNFHYGPFEWLWRAATYTRLDVPWRRQKTNGGTS